MLVVKYNSHALFEVTESLSDTWCFVKLLMAYMLGENTVFWICMLSFMGNRKSLTVVCKDLLLVKEHMHCELWSYERSCSIIYKTNVRH